MENTILPISAIICFNAGSAGDLLLALCLSQLNLSYDCFLDTNGAINLKKQYFKEITKQIYYKHNTPTDIDYNKVNPIENTHYYLDLYTNIAEQIYFIDYPDHYQFKILESFKKKRHQDSWLNFLEYNKNSLPKFAQQKVTINNVVEIFSKRWNRNLIGWRANSHMIPINFLDFFNTTKMQNIVEKIINQPIIYNEVFQTTYQSWLEKNQDLKST